MFGVTNVIRFFRNRMYDLYDEKTRERFTELDKGETVDFKTLKNFKRPQRFSPTSETSSDFRKLNETS